jgi:hypothetical protein
MKNFLLKLTIFGLILLINFTSFATSPDNQGEADTIEDPGAPINTRIIWLIIAGIAFAFYYYSTQRKKQID